MNQYIFEQQLLVNTIRALTIQLSKTQEREDDLNSQILVISSNHVMTPQTTPDGQPIFEADLRYELIGDQDVFLKMLENMLVTDPKLRALFATAMRNASKQINAQNGGILRKFAGLEDQNLLETQFSQRNN